MRIGTWNLEGRWSSAHEDVLREHADVWLLTEVPVDLDGTPLQVARSGPMLPGKSYAAVASLDALSPAPSGHVATAAATWNDLRLVSSVLPWRSAGGDDWSGEGQEERTLHALKLVLPMLTPGSVWGGDWNHELSGRSWAGSAAGRTRLLEVLAEVDLQVPTQQLLARGGTPTIDHVAVPSGWSVSSSRPIEAAGLSDHDAYVVNVTPAVG